MRFYLIAASLFFWMLPCHAQAGNQEPAEPVRKQSPSALSSFFGDESAEAIVLRAHQYDANAITMTVIGYSTGRGGFHKDPSIAGTWMRPLFMFGGVEVISVAALCVDANAGTHTHTVGRSLAHCKMARGAPLAEQLQQAGLFDVETTCRELEKEKKTSPDWKKEYEETIQNYSGMAQVRDHLTATIRGLRGRAATPAEQAALIDDVEMFSSPVVAHVIATSHEPGNEPQGWSAERLFAFIRDQQEAVQNENTDPAFASFVSFAGSAAHHAVVRQNNRMENLALLAAAHAGSLPAMRTVADYYHRGAAGFPPDYRLAQSWWQSAAMEGDCAGMFFLAITYFENENWAPAWLYSRLTEEGSLDNRALNTMAAQLRLIIESRPDNEEIHDRAMALREEVLDNSQKRMRWRSQNER